MAIDYFVQNPDVAAAYQANSYGLTPEQFASTHYAIYGEAEGRNATPEVLAVAPTTTAPVEKYEKGGKTYEVPTAILDKITSQILAQGTTDKWSGAGYGSAQANAADMAKIIATTGATDISQFGQITKEVPDLDPDGNQIGIRTVTNYGNKITGQEVPNTYSERQIGNAFGGTFAGKGNTGYRVEIAPNGTPVFYTTGASSSDAGDWMPIVQLALAATGAGGLLGNALLGAGASQVAAGALGNAILGGATTGLAGGDPLKGALLGGAGGALSGYLQGANGVTLGNASDIAIEMADAGSTLAEIEASLASRGFGADVIADSLKDATNAMLPKAANVPMDGSSLVDTVNVVAPSGAPAISTNALTNILSQIPNIVDVSNIFKAGAPPPNIEVKDTRPIKSDIPVITTTSPPVGTTPTVTNPTGTVPTTKDTSLTPSDVIKILGIGTTIAGINAATGGGGTSGGVQYPIVDVPANWATPPKTGVAPATVLPPINFGDRNLLIGTQWEKFLDPNYGQVPEPIQYSQPSSLSYNDLMGILGSKQGYPAKSSLSINDIISGIQNQYGQAPSSAMG